MSITLISSSKVVGYILCDESVEVRQQSASSTADQYYRHSVRNRAPKQSTLFVLLSFDTKLDVCDKSAVTSA